MTNNAITGFRINRFGQLLPVEVERPNGGGLEVLAKMLHCEPHQVFSLQLNEWTQVWVNSDACDTSTSNPVLTTMVEALGGFTTVGGAGVFLATVPKKWEVIGLNEAQQEQVRKAWEEARNL